MIKAIAFDVGGVITSTDFDALYASFAKRIGLSIESFRSVYHKDFDGLLIGNTPLEDIWNDLKKAGGNLSLDYKSVWLEEASKTRKVNTELLNYIGNLRKTCKVGILSNLTPTRHLLDEEIDLYSHFDFIVLSFKEKCKKPDPQIYKIALERAAVKPEEMLFIDDKEEMTEGAEKLGIPTIIYKDNPQVFSELSKNFRPR